MKDALATSQTTLSASGEPERVARAEAFVRDVLVIMGQQRDADDERMVKETAQRVLLSVYGRRLPR